MIIRDLDAVSPIVSAVMLLLIMISLVGAILAWGIPLIRDKEADTKYDASLNYFKALDATIEDLIYSGNGTTRTVNLAISDGNIFVEKSDKRWVVSYSLNNKSISFSGLEDNDGIFEINYEEKNLKIEIYHPNGYELGKPKIYNTTKSLISTNESFNETIHAKIYNSTMEIAEFWLFDTDSITHKMPVGYIKEENFAVTTNYPALGKMYVKNPPLIVEHRNSVSLSMLQLSSSGIGSGGRGNYGATLKLKDAMLCHSGNIYNLTIQIYGKHNLDWYRYLYQNHKFLRQDYNEKNEIIAVIYGTEKTNLIDFKLMQYKIDVKLEGR